jgi:hypothetical protein
VEHAIVHYRHSETARLAKDMPQKDLTVTQDETFTGGLCLVTMDPESNFIIVGLPAQARDQSTWHELMAPALAPLHCRVIQSTSDEAPGLLAYVEHYLEAHHAPDLFHMQHELVKAVSGPIATKERAAHKFVDLERGVRRNGRLIASDIHEHIAQIRTIAQHEGLSQHCLERIEKAERVVPKMQATIEFVSGYVKQQVAQLDLTPPVSFAMHAKLIPSYDLERVAETRTVSAGTSLRALAERLRPPLFAPGGALSALNGETQDQLHKEAKRLATVFQRSSSNVEERNGYLSLRSHQLRGLYRPRKRACFTTMHNFFLTRPDGMTAAERFFGQKPRAMFAAILASVELAPAPLSPPRKA